MGELIKSIHLDSASSQWTGFLNATPCNALQNQTISLLLTIKIAQRQEKLQILLNQGIKISLIKCCCFSTDYFQNNNTSKNLLSWTLVMYSIL